MIIIGYILFAFALIRLIVSFINWVTFPFLPNVSQPASKHSVSILIPARNEQKNIGNLLQDLVNIRYSPLEILVYDDSSTDQTAYIVNTFASEYSHIRLIKGRSLPHGWLGKNYACHQLAAEAKGSRLLFIDADVRLSSKVISRSLTYMDEHKLKLLSIFPTQIMPSLGSYLSVPLMNWILLSLLPLIAIRLSDRPSLSAANGQFMLFSSAEYDIIQPHKLFKNNPVEDISIIKEYKRRKLNVATLLGGKNVFCRMYSSLSEGINGFAKNVFQFFGGSSLTTLLFALGTTIAPFYMFIFNGQGWGIAYLSVILLIRILISVSSKQSAVINLALMIPQQIVFWVIIIAALIKHKQKKLVWKDRNISSSSS